MGSGAVATNSRVERIGRPVTAPSAGQRGVDWAVVGFFVAAYTFACSPISSVPTGNFHRHWH